MPKSALPTKTTISISHWETSIEVGWPTAVTTVIVTAIIPDIVIDAIPMYNVNITSGITDGFTFWAEPSVPIPPVIIPVTYPGGGVTSRTLTPPPWPSITQGPPESWSHTFGWGGGPSRPPPPESTGWVPFTAGLNVPGPTTTTLSFPTGCQTTSLVLTFTVPTSTQFFFYCTTITQVPPAPPTTTNTDEVLWPFSSHATVRPSPTTLTFPPGCPTSTLFFNLPTTSVMDFWFYCRGLPPTTTTTTELPLFTSWPEEVIIEPIEDPDPKNKGEVKCKRRFLWVSISYC